jgi:ketosteroid isomerase-like protein
MESNTDRMRRAYAAFSAGDLTTLAELMAPDCTWVVAGRNRLSGTYAGRDAVFGYFGQLVEATGGTFAVQLGTITETSPETVLVTCRVSAEVGGVAHAEDVVQQIGLRAGQAISCRTYVEDTYAWDELIGPAVITLPAQHAKASATTG